MHLIVVDCETTSLDHRVGQVVEMAWWNLSTDESGEFVPPHAVSSMREGAGARADPEALRINGYWERIQYLPQDHTLYELRRFYAQVNEQRLVAANSAFDSAFLVDLLTRHNVCRDISPWHHRMLDVEAFAAGKFDIDPAELPSLRRVCEMLDVALPAAHTAAGDVSAAGQCLRKLMNVRRVLAEVPAAARPNGVANPTLAMSSEGWLAPAPSAEPALLRSWWHKMVGR